jgi:hypothetical protein
MVRGPNTELFYTTFLHGKRPRYWTIFYHSFMVRGPNTELFSTTLLHGKRSKYWTILYHSLTW